MKWSARGGRAPRGVAGSRQAGLTTTELMTNLAIAGILAGGTVALVGNILEVDRARGAAAQVAGAMQLARQYAVSSGGTYAVTLTGTTVAVTCTAGCAPNPPAEPARPIVHGATTTTPSPPVAFGPLGTSTAPGSVVVTYPGAAPWEVRVSAAGRVRSCSPSCT